VFLALAFNGNAQNLVVNGSFATPAVTNASKVEYFDPTNLWPWQTTANNFEIWTNGRIPGGIGTQYSADGESQNLEILSHYPTNAAVWQTVPTVPGQFYLFSFYYTPRPRPAPPDLFTVSVNSNTVFSVVDDGTALTNFNWQLFSTNFAATSNLTTLSFSDLSLSNEPEGTHIDGVVLEHLPLLTIQSAGISALNLYWVGVSNETYQLESSTNLAGGGWSNLGSPVSGDGTTNLYPLTPSPSVPQMFYRVVTGP
jgi:hypothetical protein